MTLALISSLGENQCFSSIMVLFSFANMLLALHDSFHSAFKKSFIPLILTYSFHLFHSCVIACNESISKTIKREIASYLSMSKK